MNTSTVIGIAIIVLIAIYMLLVTVCIARMMYRNCGQVSQSESSDEESRDSDTV